MLTKLSGLVKQRSDNIQDLEIRNAVGKITKLERRLILQNDNRDAPRPRPLAADVRNAAGLDARDAAGGQLSSDSDNDDVDAPLAAQQPLAVQQPARQLVAPQLAVPQQAARQPVVPQPVAPQQAAPQPAPPQPPLPNRRQRRIPLAELIRENQMDYQNCIRNKLPKLLRELGVPDSDSDKICNK